MYNPQTPPGRHFNYRVAHADESVERVRWGVQKAERNLQSYFIVNGGLRRVTLVELAPQLRHLISCT